MTVFKHTWRHIRRSPYQALALVTIMTLLFFITLRFSLTAFAAQKALDQLEAKPQITIFFKDETDQKQIEEIKEKLQSTGKIASVKYISKEEALNIYREQNKDDPLLLELVTANILPASLEVSATDARYLGQLNEVLKDNPVIEETVYLKDFVEDLVMVTSGARREGLVLVVSLSAVAFLVILITIGIKISNRKAEIEIMKLVGASSWHIGRPFVLEGAFYGLSGAVLAWGLSYFLIFHETSFFETIDLFKNMGFLTFQSPFMLKVLGGVSSGGLILGSLGSSLAVWRYL